MNQYQWAYGYHARCDANEAGRICEKLESEGRLTAEELLIESRNPESPLHGAFTWKDSEAAHKWRVQEARTIIGNLRIVQNGSSEPTKRWYSIVREDPHYNNVQVLLKEEDSRQKLLQMARKDFQTFADKYQMLCEWSKTIEIGRQV